MSRFTILGATGTIGQALVAHLAASGHEVLAPARGDDALWREPLGHAIYAIGITADFRSKPFETIEAHICLLKAILARASFESLTYLSSTRVYGALARPETGASEEAVLAVDPNSASDLYNLSKLMGESLSLHSGREGARAVRLSNVVGGMDAESDNFIPALMREAQSGTIRLRSALGSAKDYIHIADVVALLPQIAVSGRHRLYNLASGRQTTHQDWVDAIAARTGCAVEVAADAPEITFPPIAIGRLRDEFGARPRDALAAFFGAKAADTRAATPRKDPNEMKRSV